MTRFISLLILLISPAIWSQAPYKFTTLIDLETTPVISQGRTGTCWSFSSTSFLESEILRLKGEAIDLSEMFTVRNTYPKKARNYIMRQGKAQFSEGGLAHDVMTSVSEYGLVPQSVYTGVFTQEISHDHSEMIAVLSSMLDTYVDNPGRRLSPHWRDAVEGVLDAYLGKRPTEFQYNGKSYTPDSFAKMTGIDPTEYFTLTSFTHVPFYSDFILNIPDNWSNGSMYNLPLDDLMAVMDHALENGFTVELDCDVSERSFSSKDGVAVVPASPQHTIKALQGVYPERTVDQQFRQEEFESYATTDDHLMHITGLLTDQNGTRYYKVKNSWGSNPDRNANGGYVYFSESYMRLKAISIMVHRDAIPKELVKKLNLP
jgi:bleomycin hydrolase